MLTLVTKLYFHNDIISLILKNGRNLHMYDLTCSINIGTQYKNHAIKLLKNSEIQFYLEK